MTIAQPLAAAARRALLAALLLSGAPAAAQAQDIDLRQEIANGKWEFAYQRAGVFKPLNLKHEEDGKSYTCIAGDPRRKLLDWVARKGCKIDEEKLDGTVYRLKGACTLKWLPKYPIPAEVELHFGKDSRHFTLDIRAGENSLLNFNEHTLASHQGECDQPPSTAQRKQDQRPGG